MLKAEVSNYSDASLRRKEAILKYWQKTMYASQSRRGLFDFQHNPAPKILA